MLNETSFHISQRICRPVDSFNHRKKYDYSRQGSFKTPSYFCKKIQDMFLQKKNQINLNELNSQTQQCHHKQTIL